MGIILKTFVSHRMMVAVGVLLLFQWTLLTGSEETSVEGGAAEAAPEIEVEIKLKGAERLDEILALKEEVAALHSLAREQESEMKKLSAERDLLRQELFESVKHLQEQNAKIRSLELSVAGLVASGKVQDVTMREDQLLTVLSEVSKSGGSLAVLAVEFCREVDAAIGMLPAGRLEQTRLRLKMDELLAESRKFSALANWKPDTGTVDRCRVLAVNSELGVVVLPVGLIHGVFNGLTYYVPGDPSGAAPGRLKVVSTRPSVALALVVDGDIGTFRPGMEVVTDLQTLINREQ